MTALWLRTAVLVCNGDGCHAYLIPTHHLHPSRGRTAAPVILSDQVHARKTGVDAGWRVADVEVGGPLTDLCPDCGAAQAAADADAWNQAHPVGTPVTYWQDRRYAGKQSRTCTPARVEGVHAVVCVEGHDGDVALTHIKTIEGER